jgi:hypothetical protein
MWLPMTYSKWNSEWERPDPLRGKRGWNGRNYIIVTISVILSMIASGLIIPAIAKVSQDGAQKDFQNQLGRDYFDEMVRDSLKQ